VEILPIEVYTKEAWAAITPYILPSEAREFTPGQKAKISLKRFRMESEETPSAEDLFKKVSERTMATAQVKILAAMQDKEEAVRLGQIDSFTRYKINFGTVGILATDEFRSGNAFLQRRYTATDAAGEKLDKPTLTGYLKGDKYTIKPPGKAKDTAADDLMARFLDSLVQAPTRMSNDEISKALVEQKKVVDSSNEFFQGLVMEIGCTGLIPRDLETSMIRYEPEAFEAKFGLKLGKAEKEGMFWAHENGLVISVTPETSWYTVKTSSETDVEVEA